MEKNYQLFRSLQTGLLTLKINTVWRVQYISGLIKARSQKKNISHHTNLVYEKPLVYSCSGCSSTAQMANYLALQLDRIGYYLGRKLGELLPHPGFAATEKKIYIGGGTIYYPGIQVGEFILESGTIKKGDTLMIAGPDIGMVKKKMETLTINGVHANIAVKGDKITFPFGTKVTTHDKLYKIVETVNCKDHSISE